MRIRTPSIIMLPGPGPVYTAYDSSNIESGAPF